jgi:hypothetical protein
VTRDEFLALYQRCVASGHKARFAVRHVVGLQEASLTCSLSPPFSAINAPTTKRRRRYTQRTLTDSIGTITLARKAIDASGWANSSTIRANFFAYARNLSPSIPTACKMH